MVGVVFCLDYYTLSSIDYFTTRGYNIKKIICIMNAYFLFRGETFMKKTLVDKINAALLAHSKKLEELKKKTVKIHSTTDLHKFIKDKVKISKKELFNNEKKSLKKLTQKNLVNVRGALSVKQLIINGSLISLILLGAGALK